MVIALGVVGAIGAILLYLYLAAQGVVRAQNKLIEQQKRAIEELEAYTFTQKGYLTKQTQIITELEAKVAFLAPFQQIGDFEQAIRERREQYLRSENEAMERAKARLQENRATIEAEKVAHREGLAEERRRMQEKREDTETQIRVLLASAQLESDHIVQAANRKADEIAGDAMVAVREARELESVARAMKNVISGYGDEYLIPSKSLLDDLAEDFSHKDAGVQLKTARTMTRELLKAGRAANCKYAEARRRETAVHFVLDAFNGKIDSILSTVKSDNYGKLRQEILDAFSLVNHNGQAFRDARITQEYLDARLQELKWAVAVVELRRLEREEQRAIQQAMREEERARREYEKAIKDSAREEQMLQKAMDQARQELATASEDHRAEYESRLRDLEQRLQEAEAKNQRAISMAQQTKRGHVYVISNVGSFGDSIYKIGMTRRLEPEERIRELGDASVPFEFDVHAMIFSDDAPKLENELHKEFAHLQVNKINPRKEFFRVPLADVRQLLDSRELEVHWTMTAEAREYRESLVLEKRVAGSVN